MVFILDENVSVLIGELLNSLGHSANRFPSGTKDKDLLAACQREKLAMVTHDQDFAALPPEGTGGILWLHIHPTWSDDVGRALKEFLAETTPSLWEGRLVLIEREGFVILP